MTAIPHPEREVAGRMSVANAAYEAYRILQIGFVVVPIIAGLDKFYGVLGDWDMYLSAAITRMVGGASERNFMMLVGVIEIAAGIGVAVKPRYFAYVVALWMLLIVINLIMTGSYYDIALRDVGLCLGALALARLSQPYDRGMFGGLFKPQAE